MSGEPDPLVAWPDPVPDPLVARPDPVPDPLAVVTQLRDLAADPMNRRAIVQDHGCLPGLILFLDHPDPQVVYCALLAVRYLAECRANREKLKTELGMMLSLQNIVQKSTTPGETKLLASEIYQLLQAVPGADEPQAVGPARGGARRKAQFFLGSSNKRAKTVILQIHGLDDPGSDLLSGSDPLQGRRSLCEEALLKIRGVISFTFQMAVKRCVVRIRSDLKAEALASAIAATEVMTAQQVVKDENGDEVLVHFPEAGSVSVEQNLDLPEYLPEEESPSQDPDKAISRVGSGQDGSSWLGTAANFLSRSFYW
ncbi:armadillo repeat-containing protein 1-like isoform X1 [Poecilia formosa]|uniref:armadillo repeat-containing protein 1-like isoform X1 n=1 Tax=Poecilia formosa TaxID=48698 RepID=UPI0007B79F21|nr:PREDICTED: armadillo repeat-containing protein 1-like isoform X1 [Poecilia formosa]